MDSKDKALMDLRKNISDLKTIIPKKDAQIEQLKTTLKDYERKAAGLDAVHNSLQSEQALTMQLNGQIDTLKKQVASLTEENESLKEINLELQQRLQKFITD